MSELTDILGDIELQGVSATDSVLNSSVAEWSVGNNDSKKLILVKIGSEERPASPKDIQYAEDTMKKAIEVLGLPEGSYCVVCTHHLVEVDVLELGLKSSFVNRLLGS